MGGTTILPELLRGKYRTEYVSALKEVDKAMPQFVDPVSLEPLSRLIERLLPEQLAHWLGFIEFRAISWGNGLSCDESASRNLLIASVFSHAERIRRGQQVPTNSYDLIDWRTRSGRNLL